MPNRKVKQKGIHGGIHLIQKTSRQFIVAFGAVSNLPADVTAFLHVTDIDIKKEWTFLVDLAGRCQEFEIPTAIISPGHYYEVSVKMTSMCILNSPNQTGVQTVAYQTVANIQLTFRAELTKGELLELQKRSLAHMKSRGRLQMVPSVWFYRNKPPEYFQHIFSQCCGVMEVYLKDRNGDQASPINAKLHGLFFGASVDKATGYPPELSNYGTRRFTVPAAYLFAIAPRMWFADFYCLRQAHYVTVVMTRPGSKADEFCQEKLLPLDPQNNPYLTVGHQTDLFLVTSNVWIEIYFTENIDLNHAIQIQNGGLMYNTESRGTSRPEGIPKNPNCKSCNLY